MKQLPQITGADLDEIIPSFFERALLAKPWQPIGLATVSRKVFDGVGHTALVKGIGPAIHSVTFGNGSGVSYAVRLRVQAMHDYVTENLDELGVEPYSLSVQGEDVPSRSLLHYQRAGYEALALEVLTDYFGRDPFPKSRLMQAFDAPNPTLPTGIGNFVEKMLNDSKMEKKEEGRITYLRVL